MRRSFRLVYFDVAGRMSVMGTFMRDNPSVVLPLLLAAFSLVLAADAPAPSPTGSAVTDAVAVVMPTQGQTVTGTVRFHRDGESVHVTGELSGLAPNAKHGFHLHEFGDCSAPDGASAGGHFAPEGHPHGAPDPATHHAGDLGNVEADAAGRAKVDVTVKGLGLATGDRAIVGRAVVVHAQPDDLTSQPAGNAGARVGCGVVGVAKPGS
jgi:superoxide dismutase, Cu-Zn family